MNHLIFRPRNWNAMSEWNREIERFFEPLREYENTAWKPACEVEETEGHYLVSVEMPGVPKDQIKIEFQDQQLRISGERKTESEKKDGEKIYSERRTGKFLRSFELPADVQTAQAEAHYEDGILRVYLPKALATKTRELKISSGPATGFFGRLLGTGSKKEGTRLPHSSPEVA